MNENNPSPSKTRLWAKIAAAVITIIIVTGFIFRKYFISEKPSPLSSSEKKSTIRGLPLHSNTSIADLTETPVPAFWLEINSVSRARTALVSNPWFQQVLQEPLGRGFVGSWSAFLGTQGQDIQASFKETVANVIFDALLTDPLQLFWFSGNQSSGTPALVIPSPSTSATSAYDALDTATSRQVISAHCATSGSDKKPATVEIKRWLLGEHSLYATQGPQGIILSRFPLAILQASCAPLPKIESHSGVDASLVLHPQGDKRESLLLATLLGLGNTVRLEMAFQDNRLIAQGIRAPLVQPQRLAVGSLSESMLRAIPADTPVVLTLQLQLPRALTPKNLQAHFKDPPSTLETRQIAILWTPHGDNQMTEIAILWSKTEDLANLQKIWSGPNAMVPQKICGHLAMFSTNTWAERIASACSGKTPSLLHADTQILSELKTPASLGLWVQMGPLLSNLIDDGFPAKASQVTPPEILAAERRLQELGPLGFIGKKIDHLLVPGKSGS